RPTHRRTGVHRRRRHHPPDREAADPAAAGPDRVRVPAVQPAAHPHRPREHHLPPRSGRPLPRPGVDGPGGGDRRAGRSPGSQAVGAVRRPAAARGGGPRPGRAAADHLRRRADRQPRLPVLGRDPHLHGPGRRRAGPDARDGAPRPGRRVVRRAHPVPGRRTHRRRAAGPHPGVDPGPHGRPGHLRRAPTVLRYALTNLRANLTRLISTALAVIIGIGFLAAGLMLTDAMRAALTGTVDLEYARVDLVVEPAGAIEGGPASVPGSVLDAVRATDGVAAAAGELTGPVNLLGRHDESLTSRAQGRSWIDDDELDPLSVESGRAPRSATGIATDGD